MADSATPLFRRVQGSFEPTPYARGPWDPNLLHGGAVAALVAEMLQDTIGHGYQPVRMTLDLVRPVPMALLRLDSELVRSGARLALAQGSLVAADKVVATASLLGLRVTPLGGHPAAPTMAPPDTPETAANLWDLSEDAEAFIGGGLSFRFVPVEGALAGGVAWLRLHRPVLPDAAPSPLARVVAAADVPSAVSGFDGPRFEGVGFINADISVHLHRLPEGEWIRVTSTSRWEATGIGTVAAVAGDRLGNVGRISQALVLTVGLTHP